MKKITLIGLLLVIANIMIAQVNLDSLRRTAQGDVEAIDALLKTANDNIVTSPRRTIAIAKQALILSREAERFTQGAESANMLGRAYSVLAKYDTALSYFFIAEGFSQRSGDPHQQASTYVNIGAAYTYMQEYKQALRYYARALEFNDESLNKRVYHNTAAIYMDQENYKMAREYLLKSLEISRESRDSIDMATTMNILGEAYRNTSEFSEAQDWYDKALAIFESQGSEYGWVIVMNNKGTLYLDQGEKELALKIYEQALKTNQKLGNQEAEATLLTNIGVVYRLKGNYDRGRSYLKSALKIALENGYLNRVEKALLELHETLSLGNKYKEAYKVQNRYISLKDSLDQLRNDRQIQELQTRFDAKERELALVHSNNENQQLRLGRQQLLLVMIAIILVVIALVVALILNRYWVIRRLNKNLEESNSQIQSQNMRISGNNDRLLRSNKELKEFAYIVSHDLKEPLRMIGSYVTLIERRYKDKIDEDGRDFFTFATRGVKQMKQLLDDLLKYMVVETNEYEVEKVALNDVLTGVEANLLSRIEETNTFLEIGELPTLRGNRSLLILLFQNLISNAIKFRSEEDPHIVISALKDNNKFLFTVKDNGIGVSEDYQKKIFSIFYRVYGKHQYEGTGIGLSICQKIVGLHGGKIWVESEEGKGSTFFFTLGDMEKMVANEDLITA